MMTLFIKTAVAAFPLHFTKAILDNSVHREGWHRLASYSLGIIFLYPFVRAFFSEALKRMGSQDVDRLELALFLAYFGAAIPFGLGTGVGWLVYDGTGEARTA